MQIALNSMQPIRNLIVIGLGLIGGSLAKAVRSRGIAKKVIGVARTQEIAVQAVELGVVDEATLDLNTLVPEMSEGDVLFIAVPTLAVRSILEQVAQCVPHFVTITDGASVKGSVLRDVREVYGEVPEQVVLGHPIAGSEKSGVEAANQDLYVKHRIILTPTQETAEVHIQRVTRLWQGVEAEVLHLGVEDHDEILGATSHLPHAIAFSLVDTLAHDSKNENIFRYAAGGFRDFTRIASSDAVMWRDIMLANKEAVLGAIDLFSANLNRLRSAIESGDEQEMLGVFTRAKAARDHFSAMLEKRAYLNQNQLPSRHCVVSQSPRLQGEFSLHGDKSISHRAVVLAALADGKSTLSGFMEGEEALATVQAFRDMGVVIEGPHDGVLTVHGVGLLGLKPPVGPIYVGHAVTTLKLLCGLLAAQPFDSEITTDYTLGSVSLEAVVEPLKLMGAGFAVGDEYNPPVFVHGGRSLKAIQLSTSIASAQTKTSLLLAALFAQGHTRLREPSPTRDHTERLLPAFGCRIECVDGWLSLAGRQSLNACDLLIPGDFSSAIVFIAAAGLADSADITLRGVGLNPTRTKAMEILRGFGLNIDVVPDNRFTFEPAGAIHIGTTESLVGQNITAEAVLAAADELPILMVVAAMSRGVSNFAGVGAVEINQKRRFQRMLRNFQRLNIEHEFKGDSLVIVGGKVQGGEVDADDDHRLALALSLFGIRAQSPVQIRNCATLETAFPKFTQLAKKMGISIEDIDH